MQLIGQAFVWLLTIVADAIYSRLESHCIRLFLVFLVHLPLLSRRLLFSENVSLWHIQWAQVSRFCEVQEVKTVRNYLAFETLGSRNIGTIFIPKLGKIASVYDGQCWKLTRRWCLGTRSQSVILLVLVLNFIFSLLCPTGIPTRPFFAQADEMEPVLDVHSLCQKHTWLYILFALGLFIYIECIAFYFGCIYILFFLLRNALQVDRGQRLYLFLLAGFRVTWHMNSQCFVKQVFKKYPHCFLHLNATS